MIVSTGLPTATVMHPHSSIREILQLIAPQPGGPHELRYRAILRLLLLGEKIHGALRHRLAGQGLTLEGFQTLAALRHIDPAPASVTVLAEKIETPRTLLNHTLTRLELSGLIVRERDATDRRVVWIRLSALGRNTIERGWTACHDCFDQLTSPLAGEELIQFLNACTKLDAAVRDAALS